VIAAFVRDKDQARLQQLEQSIRYFCRTNKQAPGMVWLSSRTLTRDRLYRGTTETLRLARELAADGHIGRVTARGRGRGKGRTLYFLPSAKKWQVLLELRRQDMPHAAIVAALGFFVRKERIASTKNVTDGAQQRSLRSSTFGTEAEKGAPAAPARRARAPSEPPRQASQHVSDGGGTPPSDRRLPKSGSALERLQTSQLETALERMRAVVRRGGADPDETTRRAELEQAVAPSRSRTAPVR
jgi:hypothetical protein